MTERRRPERCPTCRCTRILRILHGSPTDEAMALVSRGEATLGGCFIVAQHPDWECSRCRYQWFDPHDSVRQMVDMRLIGLGSGVQALPVPELVHRADGLREREWRVETASAVASLSDNLAAELHRRALHEYARSLSTHGHHGPPDDDVGLEVRADIAGPGSYKITIARGGSAPSWEIGADTWVLYALETVAGTITSLQGEDRRLWDRWPIPARDSPG